MGTEAGEETGDWKRPGDCLPEFRVLSSEGEEEEETANRATLPLERFFFFSLRTQNSEL
jgi:hypothetical protein